jgi:hypothetical protein
VRTALVEVPVDRIAENGTQCPEGFGFDRLVRDIGREAGYVDGDLVENVRDAR